MNKNPLRPGRVLGLIPAKGSSTRLPGKNVRMLEGKSLLERTVDSSRQSGVLDRVCVSTEDPEIAVQARRLGVDLPFMRPPHLARDPAGVVEVALHALDEWEKLGEFFDTLIILLTTSPLRAGTDIVKALQRYVESGEDFLMSVSREEHSPLSSLILQNGLLQPLHPEWLMHTGARKTGETPVCVRANGAVTIVDIRRFRKEKNYYAFPLVAYEMPWERGIDIDTERDFAMAEWAIKNRPAP